jgi:hypothetical protein
MTPEEFRAMYQQMKDAEARVQVLAAERAQKGHTPGGFAIRTPLCAFMNASLIVLMGTICLSACDIGLRDRETASPSTASFLGTIVVSSGVAFVVCFALSVRA